MNFGQPAAVLVSVFVNPLQFGPAEDFDSYPRDLEADCEFASRSGASALWAPSVDQVFPGGASSQFRIQVPSYLQAHLCGASRPGHFDGVVTVVARLLALVRPEVLVLGEKDWQQLVILRHLVITSIYLSGLLVNYWASFKVICNFLYVSRNILLIYITYKYFKYSSFWCSGYPIYQHRIFRK